MSVNVTQCSGMEVFYFR